MRVDERRVLSPKIGDAVVRKEDRRLIAGRGLFSDDVALEGQLYAAMTRSPHPHAKIVSIDVAAALRLPGVVAAFTGADAHADGLAPIPHKPMLGGSLDVELHDLRGAPYTSQHFPLPLDRARFVGEAVAMAIATTPAGACDAAEAIVVAYEPLPFTLRAKHAREPDAARVHADAPSNVALDAEIGDAARTAAAFAAAAHVVRLTTWVQRVTGVPLEPRAAVAEHDARTGRTTLRAGSGNVVRQRRELATVLGAPERDVRVIADDVGGNFGTRNAFYPEFALIAWAARRLGRPVKWTCDRSEAFLSDYQGRDLEVEAELALDAHGTFLALRSRNVSNVGAYSVSFGPLNKGVELMSGLYAIPTAHVRAEAVLHQHAADELLPQLWAARGDVRHRAADRSRRAPMRLRPRRAAPTQPHRAIGAALRQPAGDHLRQRRLRGDDGRRARARTLGRVFGAAGGGGVARPRLRGIGLANYIEVASGAARERAEVCVSPDGVVEIVIGTLSSGQGHETSFAQLATQAFGVDSAPCGSSPATPTACRSAAARMRVARCGSPAS